MTDGPDDAGGDASANAGADATDGVVRVARDRAERVAARAFETHGIDPSDATHTADVLVTADAMGKGSHGLLRLPRFVRGIAAGNVDPDGTIEPVRDAGAAATLSGGSRLGPVVASEAIAEATARAAEYGVGAVGVHDSNHLGMLGYYTDQARREGFVAIAVTNTEPAMPPYGGAEAVLGTNPIAVATPTDPPVNLDMSTSAIARGSVLQARERGDRLPEDVALDEAGQPTRDPAAALDGVIRPFGGVKGAGLALVVELLAGGLVGAAMGTDVTGTYHTEDPCTKGDLFLALDPERLGGPDAVDRMSAFLRDLTAGRTADGVDEIRLPGEASLARAETDEVAVDEDVWNEVRDLAGAGD
jgi:L-2-hydroxycarboxylate dehydrogenase (NAD+)